MVRGNFFQMSFEKDNILLIKNAISKELANFCMNYFLLKRDAVIKLRKDNIIPNDESLLSKLFGTWKDPQVLNSYSHYGDMVMETLLMKVLPIMKENTNLNLIPTYSYARIYKKGDELKRHKDRPSCEISTTLNLGGNIWPIYIDVTQGKGNKGTKVNLECGDMLIYKGELLEHWREPFDKELCVQVFLHYNNINNKDYINNIFDSRPLLGYPK